jgi:hypothetical protein
MTLSTLDTVERAKGTLEEQEWDWDLVESGDLSCPLMNHRERQAIEQCHAEIRDA